MVYIPASVRVPKHGLLPKISRYVTLYSSIPHVILRDWGGRQAGTAKDSFKESHVEIVGLKLFFQEKAQPSNLSLVMATHSVLVGHGSATVGAGANLFTSMVKACWFYNGKNIIVGAHVV